jgi:hypothetical protein
MQTLYDIGDEIEIKLRGVVKEYSVSEHGDSYKIELKGNNLIVYLGTDEIKYTSHKVRSSDGFDPAERFLFE